MEGSPNNSEVKDIRVKLLLAGGHQYSIFLKSDAPLLHNLLKVVVARSYKQENALQGLFQIPIEEGRASLCFPCQDLIALVTEPSVFVWPNEEQNADAKLANLDILPSSYVQIDNFLTETERNQLLEYVFQKESDFVPTSISTKDIDYRRSMALYAFPEFSDLIINRIQAVLPDMFSKLDMPSFTPSQIECQLTAHNDGNFYKVHNDNGSPDTATRELTYVYYFYREPKSFAGGELLVYDSKIENNYYVKAESFKTVEPRNNSIVFFLSRYMHEVLPVRCPSKAFADSRFTINGWLRR